MLIDDVIARIQDQVPTLSGVVKGAAELAALIKQGSLPQRSVFCFVLPLGVNGGSADAITGIYRQTFDEVIGVVLVVKSAADATGEKSLPTVDSLKDAVIAALAGWEPAGAIAPFVLIRGRLNPFAVGTVFYQIDFSIAQQLRIAT